MTHDQLIEIEKAAHRAFRAARIHADKDTCKQLDRAEYLLAEIRHCGMWLCDTTSEHHAEAKERLADLFKYDLK